MMGKVRGDARVHSVQSSGDAVLAPCGDALGGGGGLRAVRGHLLAVGQWLGLPRIGRIRPRGLRHPRQ